MTAPGPRGGDNTCGLIDDALATLAERRGEVACLDEAHDHLLLALRVLGDTIVGVGHVEVVEGGEGPGHARLARDVLLVDVGT
jgi:hypothetical protein